VGDTSWVETSTMEKGGVGQPGGHYEHSSQHLVSLETCGLAVSPSSPSSTFQFRVSSSVLLSTLDGRDCCSTLLRLPNPALGKGHACGRSTSLPCRLHRVSHLTSSVRDSVSARRSRNRRSGSLGDGPHNDLGWCCASPATNGIRRRRRTNTANISHGVVWLGTGRFFFF
jgi:hypothetical protein